MYAPLTAFMALGSCSGLNRLGLSVFTGEPECRALPSCRGECMVLEKAAAEARVLYAEPRLRASTASCRPARLPCASLCVCAAMGLDTKEASRTSQLGQSLPDHSGSSALRGDSSSGGAGAPAGSRTKHQTSACSATVTDDVEVR